jgi:hypothetical protein
MVSRALARELRVVCVDSPVTASDCRRSGRIPMRRAPTTWRRCSTPSASRAHVVGYSMGLDGYGFAARHPGRLPHDRGWDRCAATPSPAAAIDFATSRSRPRAPELGA